MMQWQVARARRYFEDADVVIGLFPRDGSRLTVRLLQQTYAGILDVIEANSYNVFTRRAFTTMPKKLSILARALWDERFLPGAVPGRTVRMTDRGALPAPLPPPGPFAVRAFERYVARPRAQEPSRRCAGTRSTTGGRGRRCPPSWWRITRTGGTASSRVRSPPRWAIISGS